MNRSRIRSVAALSVGGAVVAVQAFRQPSDTALIAVVFAVVWWLRRRLVRRPVERRRHLRHVRLHVATATLITAALWTAVIVSRLLGQTSETTAANIVDDPDPHALATDADSDPWPGWPFVEGVVTIGGLALLSGGAVTLRTARRERRRRERKAAHGAATLPHDPALSTDR